MAERPAGWVDFAEVRKVPMVDVLEYMGWLEKLERSGDELRGACPLCGKGEDKQSFSVNVGKNVFVCFACKKKGNVLDFAQEWLRKSEEKADLKAAAAWLVQLVAEMEQRRNAAQDAGEVAPPGELRGHVAAVVAALVSGLERRLEKRETLIRDLTDLVLGVLERIQTRRVDEE